MTDREAYLAALKSHLRSVRDARAPVLSALVIPSPVFGLREPAPPEAPQAPPAPEEPAQGSVDAVPLAPVDELAELARDLDPGDVEVLVLVAQKFRRTKERK